MTRLNRILPVAVGVLAAYEFLLGLWMLVSPHTFSNQIAGFGPYPPHFIRDTASWQIALGVTLFAAVSRPRWRPPLLAFAALQCGLHAINHWVDVERDASSLGVDPVVIAGSPALQGREGGSGGRQRGRLTAAN